MRKNTKALIEEVADFLRQNEHIAFAYVHGSILYRDTPADLDLAVYLYPEYHRVLSEAGKESMDFAIPLEMRLETLFHTKIDVQVLNKAPLGFKFRVISQGQLVVDKETSMRCQFEYLTRAQYFDFYPRKQEYLREAFSI